MFVQSSKLPIQQLNNTVSRVGPPTGGGGEEEEEEEEVIYGTTAIIIFNIRVSESRGQRTSTKKCNHFVILLLKLTSFIRKLSQRPRTIHETEDDDNPISNQTNYTMILQLYSSHSAKTEHKCIEVQNICSCLYRTIFFSNFTSQSTKIHHCTVIMPLFHIKKTKEQRGRIVKKGKREKNEKERKKVAYLPFKKKIQPTAALNLFPPQRFAQFRVIKVLGRKYDNGFASSDVLAAVQYSVEICEQNFHAVQEDMPSMSMFTSSVKL